MAIRQIIEIDEGKCDGCGLCETGCPEGALRVLEGKARLVGESLCDGLGACIGNCPRGAIRVTSREAEPYDERSTLEGILRQGPAVLRAHLEHLRAHGQEAYLRQAREVLASRGIADPSEAEAAGPARGACAGRSAQAFGGCPGSRERRLEPKPAPAAAPGPGTAAPSALSNWPVQLKLANPASPAFDGAKLLVAADCTAFAFGSFHRDFLEGRALVIDCPKLDEGRDAYVEKLAALIGRAASVEVLVMEVPCCSGLVRLLLDARERAVSRPPIEATVVGIEGGIVRRSTH